MQYFIAFLEGIITFVSPCLLPMLPVYISYFAGGENNRKRTLFNAVAFIAGFTVVFLALGAFAGTVGAALQKYKIAVNLVTGGIVVIFGLNFSGILKIGFFEPHQKTGCRSKTGKYCFHVFVWHDFFNRLDTLRRCVSGLGAYAGVGAGHYGGGAFNAFFVFYGTWNSLFGKCTAFGQIKRDVPVYQKKLLVD